MCLEGQCTCDLFHVTILTYLQGWKYLLLGAANENALSQMSLAYRHFIGTDGLHRDCDVAIGNRSSSIIINYHTLYLNKGAMSRLAHLEKIGEFFQVRQLQSVLIFSILNHLCSCLVYYYLFGVFLP